MPTTTVPSTQTARWTNPFTSRLLLEAGLGNTYYQWGDRELDPRPQHLDALVGERAVTNEVAEARDTRDVTPIDVGEHHFERIEVAMDVRDDGALHQNSAGRSDRATRSSTPLTKRPESSVP